MGSSDEETLQSTARDTMTPAPSTLHVTQACVDTHTQVCTTRTHTAHATRTNAHAHACIRMREQHLSYWGTNSGPFNPHASVTPVFGPHMETHAWLTEVLSSHIEKPDYPAAVQNGCDPNCSKSDKSKQMRRNASFSQLPSGFLCVCSRLHTCQPVSKVPAALKGAQGPSDLQGARGPSALRGARGPSALKCARGPSALPVHGDHLFTRVHERGS